jgi:hypothetical protein
LISEESNEEEEQSNEIIKLPEIPIGMSDFKSELMM